MVCPKFVHLEPVPCIPRLGHLGSSIRIMVSLGSPRNKGVGDIGVTIILGFCRDHGKREWKLLFLLSIQNQDLGFPNFHYVFPSIQPSNVWGPKRNQEDYGTPEAPVFLFKALAVNSSRGGASTSTPCRCASTRKSRASPVRCHCHDSKAGIWV